MKPVHHALCLNLHQPPGNLEDLLVHAPWELKEILFAMDRMPRCLWGYEDVARVHVAMSGTLLETLSNPRFQSLVYGIVDCGALLWQLQNTGLFQILGTGYYHPVLPLIPPADRQEHLARWQGIGRHLFWRDTFAGFWPPEMGFSMELIPLLQAFGYRYVLVDSEHVEAVDDMDWSELRYRPHVARYGDASITVVVRDRELSDAQESGMELGWFEREVRERTRWCEFEPLVTTVTDGENGGWFRNLTDGANYWTAFYLPMLRRARAGGLIRPTFIDDYIAEHGVGGEVRVNTGAWNTGWHHGKGFVQWTGSQAQRDVLGRIATLSENLHDLRWAIGANHGSNPEMYALAEESMWRLLRAETSCNIFWGDAWVHKAHRDLDASSEFATQLQEWMEGSGQT